MNNALISALLNGQCFPHPTAKIELLETHISWIILTGDYVYKIKKPVDFGFLDFTSLAQRKQYCEAELSLNRRSAPQIYEGLVAISGTEQMPRLDDDSAPIEYAVRMKQFEEGQLFSDLAQNHQLNAELIDELAAQVARFHHSVEPAAPESSFGSPEQVYGPMQQNFEQISELLDNPQLAQQLANLEAWTESTFDCMRPLLEQRKQDGMVRDCHGDMHLGNITRYGGKVTLFDCIEFNNDFRWIDTVSDIAFLVMDFEIYGLANFANRFLNSYLEETGDYAGLRLLNFYKAYRAIVRAKIALLTRQDPELPAAEKEELLQQYVNYMDLAEHYTGLPNRFVLTMHGISGTGKSTVAQRLVDQLGAIRIRSDVERKRLFGLSIHEHPDLELVKSMYSDTAHHDTYEKLAELSRNVLDAGLSVIIDATNLKRWQRDIIQAVADSRGVPLCIANCEASMELVQKWIKKRTRENHDPSDANLAIAKKQLRARDPLTLEEMDHTFVIHSDIVKETNDMAEKIKSRFRLEKR